jgi:ribonucleoside-triphosphate reductase
MEIGKQMLSESKFYMGYSRWVDSENRYETWDESVSRVMNMHREKYADKMSPELETLISYAEQAYKDKLVLGAQRALQFGGDQLFKHEARMYNCSVSHADRPSFFNETMYLLLCGCGVGFSVQRHHIAKLPPVARRSQKKVKIFQVPDSIEGWADSFAVLLSSYFTEGATHPEYRGCQVHFDFSKVRPKGSLISGGFKAPGPDGLRTALVKCEDMIETLLKDAPVTNMTSIVAYDFVMHMSDAVLSGGVRRSATICVFDKDDEPMLKAKTGNWFVDNPQRGRSNNSALLIRDDLTRDEWANIMKSVKDFGEPGFIFADDKEFMFNPCVEIGMLPTTEFGVSGFQFCNLTEINGGQCTSKEMLIRASKAGAILGTLQAGYTNFKYVSAATKEITEREALIGVSITGWMNNPDVLFDKTNMVDAATLVKNINKQVAALIGINQAARTTCVKPSGNASVVLGTASGIHGEHAPKYFRHVQMNAEDEVAQIIGKINPKMVETSVWSSNGTDVVVAFPVVTKSGSKYKSDLMGVAQLEYVKLAQQYWVEAGTNVDLCRHPKLRHNVSNTISVDNWDEVEQYIFDNRAFFAGISLLSAAGDRAYVQAPFAEVIDADQIMAAYGEGSLFASGLVVDALHAFNENLWIACDTAMGYGMKLDDENSSDILKRDWVRRAQKFANNYFDGDMQKMTFCLKDCYNLHKWNNIIRSIQPIEFAQDLSQKSFVDVDSLAGAACAGGVCEVVF